MESAENPLNHAGIVATAMDAIVTVDGRQRIVLFNEAASRMFGLPVQQALGQPLNRLLPTRHHTAHQMHVNRYAQGDGVARQMGAVRALTALRSDGHEFPIEASISRLEDAGEVFMTAMIRDVTEVREAERARQAQAASEAANRAKNEFLARMSHELRTPLNAVMGLAQLLQGSLGDRLTENERRHCDLLQAAAGELGALIDTMLDLRRAETDTPAPAATKPAVPANEIDAKPSGKVLYIEDNAVNALLVVEVLRQWPDVQVTLADHGAQGVAQARTLQPDVVLLDMQLPDLDGLQVMELLRKDPTTRGLKVVALSANAMPQDVSATLRAGAIDYWTKPIDFAVFLDKLRALLPSRS